MAGSFVQSWGNFDANKVVTVTVTGATANNVLIAVIGWDRIVTITSAPGWNQLSFGDNGDSFSYQVLWKIAEGNSNDNLSVTIDQFNGVWSVAVNEFTGVSTDNPIEVLTENTSALNAGVSSLQVGQTTSLSTDGIFVSPITVSSSFSWRTGGTTRIDSGFTNLSEYATNDTNKPYSALASKPFSGGVAIENPTWINDRGTNSLIYAALMAIKSPSSGPTPPTGVDAGGPYSGTVSTAIQLTGSFTPGSDPSPTLTWSIDSGGTGTFLPNANAQNPTFTPDQVGPYVLRFSVNPSDGDPVEATANLDSQAAAVEVQLNQASETNTANAWTPKAPQAVQLSQAQETDTAIPWQVKLSIAVQLNQATETNTAGPWAPKQAQAIQLNQAQEFDAARQWQVGGQPQFIQLSQAVETNTANGWTVVNPNRIQLGQAQETNTALPFTPDAPIAIQLNQAVETDTALEWQASFVQEIQLRQAVETDTAFSFTPFISTPADSYPYFRPTDYKDMYARFLGPLAQEVILLVNNGTGFDTVRGVMAHVSRWRESDMVPDGPIKLGDLRLIINAETLPLNQRPLEQKDRIEIDGRAMAVIQWDQYTRSIGSETLAIEATVRG